MRHAHPFAARSSQRDLPWRKHVTSNSHIKRSSPAPAFAPSALRRSCRSTALCDAMTGTVRQQLEDLGISTETFSCVDDVGGFSRNAEPALVTLSSLTSRQRIKTLLMSHPQLLCVPIGVWLDFLTAYGMSRQDFFRLLGSFPELFFKGSLFNAGNVIAYLQSVGLSPRDVLASVVRRRPEVLLRDVQGGLAPAVEFLRGPLGLEQVEVRDFLCRCPLVLIRDPSSDLAPRLKQLYDLGLDAQTIQQLLVSDSALLVHEKGLAGTLQLRLDFLTGVCGLSEDQALQVLRGCPGILSLSVSNLGRKWSFLKQRMSGGQEQLLDFPQLLGKNLLLQIGPRFSYTTERLGFRWGGSSGSSSRNNSSDNGSNSKLYHGNASAGAASPPLNLSLLLEGDDLYFSKRAWEFAGGWGVGASTMGCEWEVPDVARSGGVEGEAHDLEERGVGPLTQRVWDPESLLADYYEFRSSWLEREGARWTGVRGVGMAGGSW